VTIRNLDTADPQQLVAKWRIAHERANRAERIVEQVRAAFEEDYIDVPGSGWVLRPRGLRRIAEILERTRP
jgi:hypothetical protein